MKTKEPLRSEGARAERKAVRAYLRRELKSVENPSDKAAVLQQVLDWVLTRQKRYDAKEGGL